jgi:hypothetical protein
MGSPHISVSAELITHWSLNHYSEGLMRKVFLQQYVKNVNKLEQKVHLPCFLRAT